MKIPRNASFYFPTIHAKQQRKWRDITWEKVSSTIELGEIDQEHPDAVLFVKDFGDEYPVGVVANPKSGEIITIEWRHKD